MEQVTEVQVRGPERIVTKSTLEWEWEHHHNLVNQITMQAADIGMFFKLEGVHKTGEMFVSPGVTEKVYNVRWGLWTKDQEQPTEIFTELSVLLNYISSVIANQEVVCKVLWGKGRLELIGRYGDLNNLRHLQEQYEPMSGSVYEDMAVSVRTQRQDIFDSLVPSTRFFARNLTDLNEVVRYLVEVLEQQVELVVPEKRVAKYLSEQISQIYKHG